MPTRSTLHHLLSSDGGRTWTPQPDLALPAIDWFDATTFGGDAIAAVFRATDTGTISVADWQRATGAWSEVQSPFPETAISLPMLAHGADRSLVVSWGTGHPGALHGAPTFPVPELLYSRRLASCAGTRP